ncbi:MAG: beta-1,6-N-acetylglucosaminyltransferase [Schleiferiaceae bacterium]|nr:beta-1,6-N-acetylglucosaminyltransferase [Schleiferiaceae bacterium]
MHINYLILAHSNYAFLDLLIAELDKENVKFYVHVDKKAKALFHSDKSNVHILRKRYPVFWGGFGMVRATLELLQTSLLDDVNTHTRYVLISGADYPIRPTPFMEEVLREEWEYINISPAPLPHKPMSRFQYFHFECDKQNKRSIKRWVFFLFEKLLMKIDVKRKIPFKIYVGSQWFALTKNCVTHILQQVQANPDYVRFFKYSNIPDEAFFQTIIGNSEFLDKTKSNITFTDWSTNPAPAKICETHLELFAKQLVFEGSYGSATPLFARKFDHTNLYLTEKINKTLRKTLPSN